MSCLNERVVGAICLLLLGEVAFADGLVIDSPGEMIVTNIGPLPMEVVPSVPEAERYLQRYEMEYRASQAAPFYRQIENFYSVQVTGDLQFGTAKSAPALQFSPQPTSGYLRLGSSTTPVISLVDLPNTTLVIGAQPQRRLSVTVDQWVFSATARLAILHSHSTGATVTVRRGF